MYNSKKLDQWFTNQDVADMCANTIDLNMYDEVIDPCAGNKAFGSYCSSMYDIDPKHQDIIQQDFLQLNLPYSPTRLFLTNFPYGSKAKLSIQMINHASTMSDTIATIVPKTLMRYSAQRRVRSDLRLITSIDLPKNSFTRDGKICDVPSVFQVWSKYGNCLRVDEPRVISNDDWRFVLENPNYYINPNTRKAYLINDSRFNNSSLRISSTLSLDALNDKLDMVQWKGVVATTGGLFSMTKGEISSQYTEHHNKSLEIHIFQKQQPSYKWLDWDYDVAIARCESNPSVIVGSRVTDDRHWILVKCNQDTIDKIVSIDWSKYQQDKMTAGISKCDVINALKD